MAINLYCVYEIDSPDDFLLGIDDNLVGAKGLENNFDDVCTKIIKLDILDVGQLQILINDITLSKRMAIPIRMGYSFENERNNYELIESIKEIITLCNKKLKTDETKRYMKDFLGID